jgi:hypothetical protein
LHVLILVAEPAFVVAGASLVVVVFEGVAGAALTILSASIGADAVRVLVPMLPGVRRSAQLARAVVVPILSARAVQEDATAQPNEPNQTPNQTPSQTSWKMECKTAPRESSSVHE